jgi:hypothetical protein
LGPGQIRLASQSAFYPFGEVRRGQTLGTVNSGAGFSSLGLL